VGPEATEIENKDEVEIGWWIKPSVWRRGYATEGALALRDEAFERVGLDRIIGRHRPANVASGRIMERLGMTFEREAVGRHREVVRICALDRARWLRLGSYQSSETGPRAVDDRLDGPRN
jgi:RimJ/RimL family protein N-acetyltransferase